MLTTACDFTIGPNSGPEVDAGVGVGSTAAARRGSTAKPFDIEFVSISRCEHVELKLQARQYRSLHARAVERLKRLQQLLAPIQYYPPCRCNTDPGIDVGRVTANCG